MMVILILIAASLLVALVFLGGFIWAVRSGQFEDTCTPSLRILADEPGPERGRAAGEPPRLTSSQPSGGRDRPSAPSRAGSPDLAVNHRMPRPASLPQNEKVKSIPY